jgi:hypothetical protein
MFTDTIATGTTPVTYVRRSPRGNRACFVPTGDTPQNERRIEIGHEVTAARRVNTLVKVALTRPNPITDVLEEGSVQVKIVHPASFTEAEVQLLADHFVKFATAANVTKLYNQEM